jgi:hypothetical protein
MVLLYMLYGYDIIIFSESFFFYRELTQGA